MKSTPKLTLLGVVMAALALFSQPSAHAYIDPGSGSIILQAILAAIFGAAVTLKLFWQKIKLGVLGLFGARKQKEEKPD